MVPCRSLGLTEIKEESESSTDNQPCDSHPATLNTENTNLKEIFLPIDIFWSCFLLFLNPPLAIPL